MSGFRLPGFTSVSRASSTDAADTSTSRVARRHRWLAAFAIALISTVVIPPIAAHAGNAPGTSTPTASPASPSTYGTPVTFTETFTSAGGCTPDNLGGSVTFSDGGTLLGSGTYTGGALGPYTWTYTTSTLGVGAHSITATFTAGVGACSNATSPALAYTVNQATPTVTVSTSPNPSTVGQSVTITVQVSGAGGTGGAEAAPTGTVTLSGAGSCTTAASGATSGAQHTYTCSTTTLPSGTDTITANYAGDTNYTAASGSGSTAVNVATISVPAVGISPNPSTFGTAVTLSVTLTGAGAPAPAGTVAFTSPGWAGSGPVSPTSSGNTSTYSFTTSTLPVGADTITATWSPGADPNYTCSGAGCSNTGTATVNKTGAGLPAPALSGAITYGQSETITANLTGVGGVTPTGTVTFNVNGSPIATCVNVVLAAGSASCTTSALPGGSDSITYTYSGDGNYTAGTSAASTLSVSPQATGTAVSAAPASSTYGQSVTYSVTVTPASGGASEPSGSVTISVGATTLCTAPLTAGATNSTGSCAAANAPQGTDTITASYAGDTNYGSSSGTTTETVTAASTTTSVALSPTSSVYGQTVAMTATVAPVAPGGGSPDGTVVFSSNGVAISGAIPLSGGSATFSDSGLAVGSDSITAAYTPGSANYVASDSTGSPQTETVSPDNTTSSLNSSVNPSAYGQTVTFTDTVIANAPGSGTPQGTVVFSSNGTPISGAIALSGGAASFSTNALPVGTDNITADYSPSPANYNASTSNTVGQTVNAAVTTTAITSVTPASPSQYGTAVSLVATVTTQAPGTGSAPGNVQFYDGATLLGSGALSGSGNTATASYTTSPYQLAGGAHSLTATYVPTGSSYAGSNSNASPVAYTITTTTTGVSVSTPVASGPNVGASSSAYGVPVTFTSTVSVPAGAAAPTGTIDFKNGATLICSGTIAAGSASCTTTSSQLNAGSYTVTGTYNGDTNYGSVSSAGLAYTITPASTSTAVASSANPSTYGTPVTFTINVSDSAAGSTGTPTGTVTITDSAAGSTIGCSNFGGASTIPLTGGAVTCTTRPDDMPAGASNNGITVTYNGAPNFQTSSFGFPQGVNQAASKTVVTSSVNPQTYGNSVTFTATVSDNSAGSSGTPTGTVTFADGLAGSILSCTNPATLSGGVATCTTSADDLPAGANTITASYSGDNNFTSSTSAVFTETVNKANSAVTVSGSPNPSSYGTPVTFSILVADASAGGGTPTGNVTITDSTSGSSLTCTNHGSTTFALAGGSATCVTGNYDLVGPSDAISVSYAGDNNFNTSSGAMTQLVNSSTTGESISVTANPPSPSTYGTSVIFTATITVPGAAPTGTVTFTDSIGPGLNCNGSGSNVVTIPQAGNPANVATCQTGSFDLIGGVNNVTAAYSGDANYGPMSNSTSYTMTVAGPSMSAVTASPASPSVYGEPVAFSVTVTGSGARPTGTVSFYDYISGSPVLLGTGTNANSGSKAFVSTYTTTAFQLSTGGHLIGVTYSGDSNYGSATAGPISYTVNQDATTTTDSTSGSPSIYGTNVTFTSTVTSNAPGSGVPTGTVTWFDNTVGVSLGTAPLSGGTASLTINSLNVGSHNITATYNGDTNYLRSNDGGSVTQVVNKASTLTALAPFSGSVYGTPVTFSVTVSNTVAGSTGAPDGTVTFSDSAATSTLTCNGGSTTVTLTPATSTTSTASCTTQPDDLVGGSNPITATYSGSSNFIGSTTNQTQGVALATTAVSDVSSGPNPSNYGQQVTFTATLSDTSAGSTSAPRGFNDTGSATITFSATNPNGPVTINCNGSGSNVVTVNNATGQAICQTGNYDLLGGTNTVVATYSGNGNFQASTDGPSGVVQNVNAVPASVNVVSSGTSTYGQQVTFTATITDDQSAGGLPATGTVTFTAVNSVTGPITITCNGGPNTAPLNQGLPNTATCQTAAFDLTAPSDTVTATYAGDTNYNGSSNSMLQTVNPAASTTTVVSSTGGTSVYGNSVTFTAKVTGAGATATGSIQFQDSMGDTINCNSSGTDVVPMTSGLASCATGTVDLEGGSHTITATYQPDAASNYSTSSGPVGQKVKPSPNVNITAPASSLNPSNYGQPVTFTSTVSSGVPGGRTPTGRVTFSDAGAAMVCTVPYPAPPTVGPNPAPLNGADQANCTKSDLAAGTHAITGTYNGDINYQPVLSAATSQTVNPQSTTTVEVTSKNPSPFDPAALTFTATVTAGPGSVLPPTGMVDFTFSWPGQPASPAYPTQCALSPLVATGPNSSVATCQIPPGFFDVGRPTTSYTVSASYLGSSGYSPSTTSLTQKFTAIPVFIATPSCTASGGPCSGLIEGQTVTLTTDVQNASTNPVVGAPSGHQTPDGTVTFYYQNTNGAPTPTPITCIGGTTAAALSGGAANTASCQFQNLPAGTNLITVRYNGDDSRGDYAATTSGVQAVGVNQGTPPPFAVSSSSNPAAYGQTVTFSVVISPQFAGGNVPTGTVTFTSGGQTIGVGTLVGGRTSVTTATLPTGSDVILATYSGDSNYAGAAESTPPLVEQIRQGAPSVSAIQVSNTAPVFGQKVTLTVNVSGGGQTPPFGTVTFFDNGNVIATANLVSGTASITVSAFTAGSHTLSATYSGDRNYFGASAAAASINVGKANTVTNLGITPTTISQGDKITVNVAVTAANGTVPTGKVDLLDNGTLLGEIQLDGTGKATVTLSPSAPGPNNFTATYVGDANDNGSTSTPVLVTVNQASTTCNSSPLPGNTPAPCETPSPVVGTQTSASSSFPWWILVILVIIILGFLFFFLAKRRRDEDEA